MSQHLLPEHWAPSSHLARTRKDTETEADRDRETWKRTQRAKQAAEVVTYSHVISLRAQNPEERNRDPRERPRVTQRPRAPSPELLKQTRDQGCGSPASLPLSLPSSHSSVSSPSCASSTHPKPVLDESSLQRFVCRASEVTLPLAPGSAVPVAAPGKTMCAPPPLPTDYQGNVPDKDPKGPFYLAHEWPMLISGRNLLTISCSDHL